MADLIVQSALHDHVASNVGPLILQPNVNLTAVQSATHVHTSGNVTVSHSHPLVVQNAVHTHVASEIVFDLTPTVLSDASALFIGSEAVVSIYAGIAKVWP